MPPVTGNSPPSSAWTSASTMIITDATIHAMIADGPAIVTAVRAPNNQPDPMIEPSDAHRSPRNETLRSIPSNSSASSGS